MFERFDLFSSSVYKTSIDPDMYDKDEIVDTLLTNYKINPKRNCWDPYSDLHHMYNDWDNPNFQKIDHSSLIDVYDSTIKNFFTKISWSKSVAFKWNVTNFTVNTKHMKDHDHFYVTDNGLSMFSCVHYLKFDPKKHAPTSFINSQPLANFPMLTEKLRNSLSDMDTANSPYFNYWNVDTEEDDFFIFPSWLRHEVRLGLDTDYPRIASVINIDVIF